MLSLLLSLLIVAIVLGVVYWGLHKIWSAMGLPSIILVILDVLLVIVFVFYLVRIFGLENRLAL